VRLGNAILVALLAAGLLPVIVLGWISERIGREELAAAVGGAQARQAEELAWAAERYVVDRLQGLSLATSYIPFDSLSPREITAALAIPYRQLPGFEVIALLDAEGRAASRPVHEPRPEGDPVLPGHEPVDAAGLEAFSRSVPLRAALEVGAAIGPPYRAPSSGVPRVALAVRVGARGDKVLAAELSLGTVARRLAETDGRGVAYLLDGQGRPLSGSVGLSPGEADLAASGARAAHPSTRMVTRLDGAVWLASYAPVGSLGWGIVVARPEAAAFGAVSRFRRYLLYWAAVAVALTALVGIWLARSIARPVERLTAAARALTEGRHDEPLPEAGSGELGSLAGAFSHMALEVRRRDEEIRAWNADLQSRVDRKTAELREAQVQLERSRRLTALGSLSAGVAHGLNDPLTAVAGFLSMARAEARPDSEAGRLLERALSEVRRVTRVVHDLRRMAAPGPAAGLRRFPLAAPAETAIRRLLPAALQRGVALSLDTGGSVPALEGDPDQIETLVERLVENALEATPAGGRVDVVLAAVEDGALRLTVADTGVGVSTEIRDRIFDPFFTTRSAVGAGVGLTVAHGIVEAHHGRISVESEEGKGSRFTVILPAAPASPQPA